MGPFVDPPFDREPLAGGGGPPWDGFGSCKSLCFLHMEGFWNVVFMKRSSDQTQEELPQQKTQLPLDFSTIVPLLGKTHPEIINYLLGGVNAY